MELDGGVVGVLMAHRLRQDVEREDWGGAYLDHGWCSPARTATQSTGASDETPP